MVSERLTYFLGVVFAVAGWSGIQIVDRILKAPVICIDTKIEENSTYSSVNLTIENITRNIKFRNLGIVLLIPEKNRNTTNKFTREQIIFHGVGFTWEGDTPPDIADHSTRFTIDEFRPGDVVEISQSFIGNILPRVSLRSADNLRVTSPTFEVWLVKNEFWVYSISIAVAIFIFIVAVILQIILEFVKKPTQDNPKKNLPSAKELLCWARLPEIGASGT